MFKKSLPLEDQHKKKTFPPPIKDWETLVCVLSNSKENGVLIYLKPIGDIGWKRIDSIWLGVAVIGLVGQSAQVSKAALVCFLK